MALAEDIHVLRQQTLDNLNVAYDYYADTKTAWDLVHELVATGKTFSIKNQATGTVTSEIDLAGRARGYVAQQLAEATFQQFISMFENFFADLLRRWLLANPRSLSRRQVDFETILDAPDKEAITLLVVNKELNEISYQRPADWFKYLEKLVHLGCPAQDEIDRIAEAKASRDVLIHNQGVANRIYESKAGRFARYKDGQRIDIPEDYHRQTWELIRKVVTNLSDAAIAKAT